MPAPWHGTPDHSPTANSSTEPQDYSPVKAALAFISPTDAESAIIEAAAFASLPIRRCTRVVPVEGAEAKRILWLLSRREMAYVEDTLTIAHVDGTFTQEYINLTGAFYLKMPD